MVAGDVPFLRFVVERFRREFRAMSRRKPSCTCNLCRPKDTRQKVGLRLAEREMRDSVEPLRLTTVLDELLLRNPDFPRRRG